MYRFRLAQTTDLEDIMEIIAQCQAFLARGGVDQWQDGYPTRQVIEHDINSRHGYILERGGEVAAYAALIAGIEESYLGIENGEWLSDLPYITLHRLAANDKFRGEGIGEMFFGEMERQAREQDIHSLRADTHRDNLIMQHLLTRLGFTLCGDIYLRAASHRFAYEKLLIK